MQAFKFISSEFALKAIEDGEIKVSQFNELNDPFELLPMKLTNPLYQETQKKFKDWTSEQYGLICFSRKWHNPLLWSHYGDKHKGVALEFQLDDEIVSKVEYSEIRLEFDIEKKLTDGGFSEKDASLTAITKFKDWTYEQEIRVFVELKKCQVRDNLYFEKLDNSIKIVGFVLGPLCTLSLEEIKKALPEGHQLHVSRSCLANESFDIVDDNTFERRLIHGVHVK